MSPEAVRLDKLSPEQREKHILESIEKKKDQRGTADDALKIVGRVEDVPLAARDELKALREELRDVRDHAEDKLVELRKRLRKVRHEQHPDDGPAAAVKFGLSQVGVTESPAGSNWGHPVEDWIKRTGYTFAVPWCGCFAHECVVEKGGAGIPVGIRFGYGPSIIADAKAGVNGLHAVPFTAAEPGDVLVFWGGEHIGVVREHPSGLSIATLEGNTSPSAAGNQYNGGCVAAKTRSQSDVTVVARPAW